MKILSSFIVSFFLVIALQASDTDPLFYAIEKKDLTKVKQLIRSGKVNLNSIKVDGEYSAPLAWACADGAFEIAYFLLDEGADPNGSTTYETALQWLASQLDKGYSEDETVKLAEYMLKKGAKVDKVPGPENNGTPLMAAADNNSRRLVDLFLKYGADRNIKDNEGKTAADHAERAGHIELANYLRGKTNEEYHSSLHYMAKENKLSDMKELLQKTPKSQRKNLINEQEAQSKNTPLHYAAMHGNLEIAKLLVKYGADINIKGLASFTPLHTASAYEKENVASFLVKKGANINVVQTEGCATGYTSMSWAITHGMKDLVSLMLKHKGNPFAADEHPLITGRQDLETVKVLVEEGNVIPDAEVLNWYKGQVNDKYDPEDEWFHENIKEIYAYLKKKSSTSGNKKHTGLFFGGKNNKSKLKILQNANKAKGDFEPVDIRKIRKK
ncbi:MAG: ankyrin repeat domain-containing protein [Leptospiraceae bacterium]|nr:ankyrin repeat domain-containing protein [Leptospiraceae bacterium]MCP5502053.1 ankyrin repeat domain-containing protein [Leptospiraceae bacterium]